MDYLVYGFGGHAHVVVEVLQNLGYNVLHCFDDDPTRNGADYMPSVSHYKPDLYPEAHLIIAIGNCQVRQKIAQMVNHKFGTCIHNQAVISNSVTIGAGVQIMARAVVQPLAQLGNHVIVNTGAIVEHHVIIDSYVHIGPGVVVCGSAKIESGVFLGAGSIILPNVIVGANSVVAAGAVVTKNIKPNTTVMGIPAVERNR